ncbi:MAG TPA: copper resistance protein CopC [Terriglobia bacterium]|nr:copper resistance protein CopC [Terriglobia bacterium]
MKSLAGHVICILLFAIVAGAPLYAQAKIEKTEPVANSTISAAPRQIQIWFTDAPVAIKAIKLNLIGPLGPVKLAIPVTDGRSVSAAVVGSLPDGTYVATWQSAGIEKRVQRGQFRFTVKTR